MVGVDLQDLLLTMATLKLTLSHKADPLVALGALAIPSTYLHASRGMALQRQTEADSSEIVEQDPNNNKFHSLKLVGTFCFHRPTTHRGLPAVTHFLPLQI